MNNRKEPVLLEPPKENPLGQWTITLWADNYSDEQDVLDSWDYLLTDLHYSEVAEMCYDGIKADIVGNTAHNLARTVRAIAADIDYSKMSIEIEVKGILK